MNPAHKKLTVAISSGALFDLSQSHEVFEKKGLDAYRQYQIDHENDILKPGVAFPLVKKLVALKDAQSGNPLVEVILLSRNSADTGLRVFNSIQSRGLGIIRAVFTSGRGPFCYISAFEADLFLSVNPDDVKNTLQEGYAAATLIPSQTNNNETKELRIAFDGDSVLFSDEAEKVYQEEGIEVFEAGEKDSANIPLGGGPFKGFLEGLHRIQSRYPDGNCPIRTALVTARGAPAHERVIRTLRAWNIKIDEALFLGGKEKGPFLKAFGADIFFDDQIKHCDSASRHVATAHVPHGIANTQRKKLLDGD